MNVNRIKISLVCLFGILWACGPIGADEAPNQIEKDFKMPPHAARLQAYWFWVDSDFSKKASPKTSRP